MVIFSQAAMLFVREQPETIWQARFECGVANERLAIYQELHSRHLFLPELLITLLNKP